MNQAKTFLFMALLTILFVWLEYLTVRRQRPVITALFRNYPSTDGRIRRFERMTA